jgi:hypothetical protein
MLGGRRQAMNPLHTPKTLNPIAPDFPLAAAALAPLRAKAERENRSDFSPLRPG